MPSNHFTCSALPANRKKKVTHDHPLAGIEKDGILTVFKSRQLEAPVQDLLNQFYYFDSLGEVEAAKQILDQIAAIPDVPKEIAERFLGRGAKNPMGLSVPSYPRKPPKRRCGFDYWRGDKGITAKGKRMIASSCVILSNLISLRRLGFLTVTIPPLSPDQREKLNASWMKFAERYREELFRELERHGLPQHLIQVSEIQEKRFKATGDIYFHLHMLFVGRHEGKWWVLPPEFFRDLTQRLLKNLGIEVDCSAATRVEALRKNPAKEMAKYLSKGGKVFGEIRAAGKSHELPSRWWYATPWLKDEVKRQTVKAKGEAAGRIIEYRHMLKDLGLCKFYEIWKDFSVADGSVDTEIVTPLHNRQVLLGIAGFFVNGVDAKPLFTATSDAEFLEAVNQILARRSSSQGSRVSVCS